MSMYTTEGIILSFFFIAFKWPEGVDKKQLPAMLSTWQNENITANEVMLKALAIKTIVKIHDMRKPVMEHARNPITLCLKVIFLHKDSSLPAEEKILSFGYFVPSSFPIFKLLYPPFKYIQENLWKLQAKQSRKWFKHLKYQVIQMNPKSFFFLGKMLSLSPSEYSNISNNTSRIPFVSIFTGTWSYKLFNKFRITILTCIILYFNSEIFSIFFFLSNSSYSNLRVMLGLAFSSSCF